MGKKYLISGILVMALTLSVWGDQIEGQGHEPGICVPSAGQESRFAGQGEDPESATATAGEEKTSEDSYDSRFTVWNIDEDGREGLLVIVVSRQTDSADIQYTFYSRTR